VALIKEIKRIWEEELGEARPAIWSWDNPAIHGKVLDGDSVWARMDITPAQHTQLPRYSPDMHCVIELTHAHVMRHMQSFINVRKAQPQDSLNTYLAELKRIFHNKIKPAWVRKTTHRLFLKTLPAILEAQGQYPPKSCR
jgi:hypothetical protein